MPRARKPARLYLHPKERVWLIRDGAFTGRTGCSEGDVGGAEKKLAEYVADKFQPVARESRLAVLTVPEVLTAYGRERAPHLNAPDRAGYAIAALLQWWGDKTLTDIRGATCRAYASFRAVTVKPATIRRELAVLAAAITHWHKEHGPLDSVPIVTRPEKPEGKPDWLNRSHAAALLAGALGWHRFQWSDIRTRKITTAWKRDRAASKPHLARFILLGLYTGTRPGAITALQWMPNTTGGWVDFERGIIFRRGQGVKETTKRQRPARLGRRILAHLRRWKRIDDDIRDRVAADAGQPVATHLHIVSWGGRRVFDIRKGWRVALESVGLKRAYTPHVLRHTRATWMMQDGVSLEEAASSLSMSIKTLEDVYWHHHPDFQKRAAEV